MKNKVLVAMGIGISAALAASCFTVDAKADEADLQKIAEDNKANDGTTIVEEESTNEDLNNDGDKEDKYEVVNDADAWNQITDDPISDDSTQFNDAVELATVTFTDTFKEEYNEATDPNAGINYEQDLTDLKNKGYTIDESGSTLVTDREAIDPNKSENKDLDPDELAARKADLSNDYPDLVVSADENALEALKTDYIDNKGYDADKVVIEKDTNGTAIGKITATKEIGSGSMDADPVVGATVTSSDGKTYTISEIKSDGFLVLIDNKGVTYDATWEKIKTGEYIDSISKSKYDKLSDAEKALWEDPVKPEVSIDNAWNFNIISLGDCSNEGKLNGSMYVGGTLTGSDAGEDNLKGWNFTSYINDDQSSNTFNASKESVSDPDAVKDYWEAYANMLWDEKNDGDEVGFKTTLQKITSANSEGKWVVNGVYNTTGGDKGVIGNGQDKTMYLITEKNVTVYVNEFTGFVIAPFANVVVNSSVEDFGGFILGATVKNEANTVSRICKDISFYDSFKVMPEYSRTWDGENHVETQERYKVSADEINHKEYKLVAHKDTSKTFYGERYVAPDLPPAGPDLPPAGPDVPPTGPDTPPTPPTPPAGPTPAAPPTLAPAPVAPAAPAAAPDGDVLGARRGNGGSVLGARRSLAPAVLGKKRAPETGDTMAVFGWLAALMGTLSGAGVSAKALKKTKKEDK